jgi:aminomethyltransferase
MRCRFSTRASSTSTHTVRTAAGLFDVSHMGELTMDGPDALRAVDRLVTNDVQGLIDGQARYTVCCNEAGTPSTTSSSTACGRHAGAHRLQRLQPREDRRSLHQPCGRPTVRDISDDTALIALQGPKAMSSCARPVGDPAWPSSRPSTSATPGLQRSGDGVAHGVHGRRRGGDLLPAGRGGAHVAGCWRSGSRVRARPAGLGARNTLRLECKMALYGNDIDESTNPLEAGLGWVVARQGPTLSAATRCWR